MQHTISIFIDANSKMFKSDLVFVTNQKSAEYGDKLIIKYVCKQARSFESIRDSTIFGKLLECLQVFTYRIEIWTQKKE